MPNQSYSGIHGDPWHDCDRCKRRFRCSALQRQLGRIVCPDCVDDLTPMQRPRVAQTMLSNGEREADVAEILKSPVQDEDEYFGVF